MAPQGRLAGVIPPLVIPLTNSRELDVESLERLVNHLIAVSYTHLALPTTPYV